MDNHTDTTDDPRFGLRFKQRVTLATDPRRAPGSISAIDRDGAGAITRLWVTWDVGRTWVYQPDQLVSL